MKTTLVTLFMAALAAPLFSAPVLSDLDGKVSLRAPAATDWAAARQGQQVPLGAKIRTGWLSWAEIRYDDGSLVSLGPDTEYVIYTAKEEEYFSRVFRGFVKGLVKNARRKFSIKTPTAVAAVQGTRFTISALKSGTTKVKAYNGIVLVSDGKGVEAEVKPEEMVAVDSHGAGKPVRSSVAALMNGWIMEPPAGFKQKRKNRWEMYTPEAAGFSFKGRPVTLEHREVLTGGRRSVVWKEGKVWPAECPGGEAPKEMRLIPAEGNPLFSFSCPAKTLSVNTWQNRFYEIPILSDGSASYALRLQYTHHVQAKLPPVGDLRKLYGGAGRSSDYRGRYQADVMPLVAQATPYGRVDGPGFAQILESVLTLYQAKWAKKEGSYTGKVVPLIE